GVHWLRADHRRVWLGLRAPRTVVALQPRTAAPRMSEALVGDFLRHAGLGTPVRMQTLEGGVSADIWRVDVPGAAICVKRALPRLRVAEVGGTYPTDAIFYAIRLEPYLVATAAKHPDMADTLQRLAQRTAASKHCLVHGDVSPKNILVAGHGPVFLDAECAWYGDPAFDV